MVTSEIIHWNYFKIISKLFYFTCNHGFTRLASIVLYKSTIDIDVDNSVIFVLVYFFVLVLVFVLPIIFRFSFVLVLQYFFVLVFVLALPVIF